MAAVFRFPIYPRGGAVSLSVPARFTRGDSGARTILVFPSTVGARWLAAACTARPKGGPAGGREPNRARDERVSAGRRGRANRLGRTWLARTVSGCAHPGSQQVCAHPGSRQGCADPTSRQGCADPTSQQVCAHPGSRQGCAHPGSRQGCADPTSRQGGNERGRVARRTPTKLEPQASEASRGPQRGSRGLPRDAARACSRPPRTVERPGGFRGGAVCACVVRERPENFRTGPNANTSKFEVTSIFEEILLQYSK